MKENGEVSIEISKLGPELRNGIDKINQCQQGTMLPMAIQN